jgi:hypothetical protein
MLRIVSAGFGILLLATAAVGAQDAVIACQEQAQLEQVHASDGDIMPEGCRKVTVSVLEDDGERLCLVDFAGTGEGLVDQLREATVTERWWMRCEDLLQAAR